MTSLLSFFFLVDTNDNANVILQSFLSKLSNIKKKSAEDTLVPPLWENGEKTFFLILFVLFTWLHAAEPVYSR